VRPHPWALVGVVMAASVTIAGCAPPSGSIPPRPTGQSTAHASAQPSEPIAEGWWQPAGEPTTLAASLEAPWSVLPLPEGGALISERDTGTVRELGAEGTLRTAGVIAGVVSGGESGLHGLALWEDDRTRTWLYAYHGAAEDNRVVRMPLLGEPGSLSLGEAEAVFTGIPRSRTHNGGRLAFGPDGLLYVTTGDAQLRDAAQDADAWGGKILRITPEGDPAPGNPFGNAVWTLGHRNVQGIAWTPDGRMWASEFGQDTWDELNEIVGGANYGWPVVEGEGGGGAYADPVIAWPTSEASPSGIAAVGSTVFVAGLRGERLWAVEVSGTSAAQPRAEPVLEGQGRLRDVVVAPDGALWVLTNNTDGRGSPRAEDDVLIRLPIARDDG
jgi:glucose/arabinose dehydrogenase